MESPDLFRQQARDAAASRYGMPVRPLGVGTWALTGFMLVLVFSVALFLITGRHTRKETVAGVLRPTSGAARIIAMSPGVVTEVS